MSVEVHSRDAILFAQGSDIGWAKNVTIRQTNDAIKDYKLGSQDPSSLEYGNKTYIVEADRGYVDSTYAALFQANTKITIELRPNGTGAGKQKVTLSNVVLTQHEVRVARNAIILEGLRGESASAPVWGTQ